eukprot:7376630-Prymnesium_polylepis.2
MITANDVKQPQATGKCLVSFGSDPPIAPGYTRACAAAQGQTLEGRSGRRNAWSREQCSLLRVTRYSAAVPPVDSKLLAASATRRTT